MKINLISFLLTFITINSFGQISFEKGYFINNDDQRVECLIKNKDWKNNPEDFEYKQTSEGGIEKGGLGTTKEFGIAGISKYVRADTKIDMSHYDVNNLSKRRDPEWLKEKLFLKVMVEGKATLYYYENSGLIRFFYSVAPDSVISQLIYKEYFNQKNKDYVEEFEISVNNDFHQQLWVNVRCANTSTADIEKITYRKSELVNYFINYNKCSGITNATYEKKNNKDSFHLKVSPGLNYSSMSVINTSAERFSTDFNNQLNFRIGLEAELILPFNKNKWGFLFEPTFQYFYSEKPKPTYVATMDLKSIEFPLGIRYYFFLNPNLKLFTNIIYVPGFSINFNSALEKRSTTQSILPAYLEILRPSQSFAFGGGIRYKKYSAEIRYYTNRNLLNNYASWYSDYRRISLILGFRIL